MALGKYLPHLFHPIYTVKQDLGLLSLFLILSFPLLDMFSIKEILKHWYLFSKQSLIRYLVPIISVFVAV